MLIRTPQREELSIFYVHNSLIIDERVIGTFPVIVKFEVLMQKLSIYNIKTQ